MHLVVTWSYHLYTSTVAFAKVLDVPHGFHANSHLFLNSCWFFSCALMLQTSCYTSSQQPSAVTVRFTEPSLAETVIHWTSWCFATLNLFSSLKWLRRHRPIWSSLWWDKLCICGQEQALWILLDNPVLLVVENLKPAECVLSHNTSLCYHYSSFTVHAAQCVELVSIHKPWAIHNRVS